MREDDYVLIDGITDIFQFNLSIWTFFLWEGWSKWKGNFLVWTILQDGTYLL